MIILKRKIDLSLSNSDYLKSDFEVIHKLVKRHKYQFKKDGNQVEIDRLVKDTYDYLGGELYKMCVLAKGKISSNGNNVQLDLKVGLTPFFRGLLIAFFLIFGMFTFFAFQEDFKVGRTMGVISLLCCALPYWFLFNGVKNFRNDLEEDLKFLDSEKS